MRGLSSAPSLSTTNKLYPNTSPQPSASMLAKAVTMMAVVAPAFGMVVDHKAERQAMVRPARLSRPARLARTAVFHAP